MGHRIPTEKKVPKLIRIAVEDSLKAGLTMEECFMLHPVSMNQVQRISKNTERLPHNSRLKDKNFLKNIASDTDFERLRKRIYYMVRSIATEREDIDEIVNYVWLEGKVQKAPDELVFKVIRYDISRFRFQRMGGKSERKTKLRSALSLESLMEDEDNNKASKLKCLTCYEKQGVEDVDTKDYINTLLGDLDRTDRMIMHLRYRQGAWWEDIAKAAGITKGNCQIRHNKIIKQLKKYEYKNSTRD